MKRTLLLFALTTTITAFAQDQKKAPPPPPLMMNIPALTDGAAAPVKFTCTNAPAGVSPAIEWKNAPAATQSFAVLLHDPEPRPGKSIYDVTHWFIWNIPATATGLPEGVPAGSDLPDGSHQLKRGNPAVAGYYGPCAPPGPDHHYTFELYALDSKLDLSPDATRADAMKALDGHILAADVFVVLYHRP
ncbi:MAG: YbhB/YbcL family Raf kinase inhibitor-like protein [Bryobacteraceae bacterium]